MASLHWPPVGMARLDAVDARSKLKPRVDPYWLKLSTGCVLGYRKMVAGSIGTWLARYRDAETGQRDKRSLGHFDGLPASPHGQGLRASP